MLWSEERRRNAWFEPTFIHCRGQDSALWLNVFYVSRHAAREGPYQRDHLHLSQKVVESVALQILS